MEPASATSGSRPALMTRRERREAEERAREEALRAVGSSGDTVVVGGITFRGPAPISPALGTPVAPATRRTTVPQAPVPPVPLTPAPAPAPQDYTRSTAVPSISARPAAVPGRRVRPSVPSTPSFAAPTAAPRHLPAPAPVRQLPARDLPSQASAPARSLAVPPARVPAPGPVPTPAGTPSLFPRVDVPATPVVPPVAAPAVAPVAVPETDNPAPTPSPVTPSPVTHGDVPHRDVTHRDLPSRAERAGREPGTEAAPRGRAWLPRVAVLGALAAATIAAPLAPMGSVVGNGGVSPFDLDLAPSGPSTLDVVSARATIPPMAAGIEAAPVVTRDLSTVSRSQDRDPLPGCDASVPTTSTNGNLTDAELCDLPFAPGARLSTRAAIALTALNDAFRDEFGTDIALVDSYRSLGRQYSVKESRGYLAARPGTSMHGLGLAIDLASSVTGNSAAYKWLVANGAAYGWENPPWARRGGAGNYEPWHFEFRPGVEEVATWH